MERDTVTLLLEEYNNLRDFKQAMECGKTVMDSYITSTYHGYRFYKPDEVCKDIIKRNKELENENYELKEKLKKLLIPKEKTIDDLEKMSVREFRKWKNELKRT